MIFHNKLKTWYLKNKRDLPWRNTSNPYYVWLSEIILQQTRIQQGLAYYEKFITNYPTIKDLANADEEQVLKDWQGLGYYSRARNLHASAKYIHQELSNKFPNTYKEILKLKGVGDYTASAIASICFDEPTAVVDGNVYRVLSRIFNVDIPINSTKGIKYFKELAQELIIGAEPSSHNQALMDFGSMVCKPQNPECNSCPFENSCEAKKQDTIAQLPVKEKKIKIKKRYLNFIVCNSEAHTFIEKREGKGIWENLYQFPLLELNQLATHKDLKTHNFFSNISDLVLYNEKTWVHKLSHQHLYTQFWILEGELTNNYTKVSWSTINDYPVPRLIHKFLEEFSVSKSFS